MKLHARLAAALAAAGISLATLLTTPAAAGPEPSPGPTPATSTPTTQQEPFRLLPVSNGGTAPAGWDNRSLITPGRDSCPTYWVCFWPGTNFTGIGLGYSGNVVNGDWVDWLDTQWENHVYSAVNKGTGPVEFRNWTGKKWEPLGTLYPGYDFSSGWPGANQADGLVYRG